MVLPPPVCSTTQRPVPPRLASILANSCRMPQRHLIAPNPPANLKDNYQAYRVYLGIKVLRAISHASRYGKYWCIVRHEFYWYPQQQADMLWCMVSNHRPNAHYSSAWFALQLFKSLSPPSGLQRRWSKQDPQRTGIITRRVFVSYRETWRCPVLFEGEPWINYVSFNIYPAFLVLIIFFRYTPTSGIWNSLSHTLLTLVSLSATCSQTQFNANIIINFKKISLDLSHRPSRFRRLFSFGWRPFRSGCHNKNYRMNFILLSITLRWPPPCPLQLPFSVPCDFYLWGTPCLWNSLTVQHQRRTPHIRYFITCINPLRISRRSHLDYLIFLLVSFLSCFHWASFVNGYGKCTNDFNAIRFKY